VRRIRVAVSELCEGERTLSEAESNYLVRVHRASAGQRFWVFDSAAGIEAQATLLDADPRAARAQIETVTAARRLSVLPVTLVHSLAKGEKVDQVVRDATALGARRVMVCATERSVVQLGERASSRRERWQKVAQAAARQSGRGDLPDIEGPMSLQDALARAGEAAHRVVLDPRADAPLAQVLDAWDGAAALALLIGPEGGLTSAECDRAQRAGFVRARFGTLTLRTETAAAAALGALLALARA
jgi:16S rRNA (uracil1498-N3)-methyltransferase